METFFLSVTKTYVVPKQSKGFEVFLENKVTKQKTNRRGPTNQPSLKQNQPLQSKRRNLSLRVEVFYFRWFTREVKETGDFHTQAKKPNGGHFFGHVTKLYMSFNIIEA